MHSAEQEDFPSVLRVFLAIEFRFLTASPDLGPRCATPDLTDSRVPRRAGYADRHRPSHAYQEFFPAVTSRISFTM